jgi:hypothetical protein
VKLTSQRALGTCDLGHNGIARQDQDTGESSEIEYARPNTLLRDVIFEGLDNRPGLSGGDMIASPESPQCRQQDHACDLSHGEPPSLSRNNFRRGRPGVASCAESGCPLTCSRSTRPGRKRT